MRVLFDHDVPWPLRKYLIGHDVTSARLQGWEEKKNGDLLKLAETHGFDLFLTCDTNMRYQQQVLGRKIGILVVTQTNWRLVERHAGEIVQAVNEMSMGSYRELEIAPKRV
jgi:hypothetical protein